MYSLEISKLFVCMWNDHCIRNLCRSLLSYLVEYIDICLEYHTTTQVGNVDCKQNPYKLATEPNVVLPVHLGDI